MMKFKIIYNQNLIPRIVRKKSDKEIQEQIKKYKEDMEVKKND